MDSFQSVLGDAAGGALCNVLSAYGSTAPLLTAISLVEPTPVGEALAVSAGLAGLAAAYGCQWDPNGQGPPSDSDYYGCQEVSSGYLTGFAGNGSPNNPDPGDIIVFDYVVKILEFKNRINPQYGNWTVFYDVMQSYPPGSTPKRRSGSNDYNRGKIGLYTSLSPDAVCGKPAPSQPPQPPTYKHTDPASGCELNVDFKGWGVDQIGNVNGVWQIAPASITRASGGVIGGCNFAPTIYIDGGGGGQGGGGPVAFPVPDPLPPDGDEPWWAPLARGAVQGLAAAAVQKALDELFRQDFVGGSYELKGVCELDPDGNPMDVTRSTNYPAAPGLDAVLYRLDALADMFQFDKELRQPTCLQTKPSQTGQPVTINWRSDVYTDTGNNVARKRFTYFDQVGSSLESTVTHWKDFTWTAGLVIVNCLGTELGKPQIWAASLDEAKRVFAHAAAIAGVDLTNARYEVGTSKDPRYGFTGLMRVARLQNGTLAVTMRDGPSGLPNALA